MATRKKRKQRTTQLLAASALLTTVVAPYVINAEEISSSSTNTLQNEHESVNIGKSNTLSSSGTTADSTTIDSTIVAPPVEAVQLTAFDKLEPGSYHIGFNSTSQNNLFKLNTDLNMLPAQVEVTADKQYRITLQLNRNNVYGSYVHEISLSQQEKNIDYEILSSTTKTNGTIIPTTITFTVNTLNESIAFNAIRGSSSKMSSVLTFNETTIVESAEEVLPTLSQIENGIYDVELDSFEYSRSKWQTPDPKTTATIAPEAQLEVIDGKYFITAQFKGVDYTAKGTPENNYYIYNVKSIVMPWSISSPIDSTLLAYDEHTQTSTFKFQVYDPFSYNQLEPRRMNYNVTPQQDDGYTEVFVQVNPNSLKKVDEVAPLTSGNYTANIYHRKLTTDSIVEKVSYSLGKQANIQLNEDGTVLVTIAGLDNAESQYRLSTLSSEYLKEEFKDSSGYTYALQFELPSIDTPLTLDLSLFNKSTEKYEESNGLYLDINDATIIPTDTPLQFEPTTPHIPFELPDGDGEYSVDVRLLNDTKTAPVTAESDASKYVALTDTKVTVKDGQATLSGTLKTLNESIYPTNIAIENQYGSLAYSPVTVTKGINKETGNFSQEISFPMSDLSGLYRLLYDTNFQSEDSAGSVNNLVRVSVDVNSIKPYVEIDKGLDLPYTITPDETNEMGAFIANYLSPYFEKPAKFKVEDGVPYAYVTVSGKMYVANADKFRYVAADGSEHPVEVVYNNGKSGLELVRTVKFPIHQKQMKLFVDSGGYGEYYLYTDFTIDESILPETPVPNPGDNGGSTGETPTPNPGDSETTPDSGNVDVDSPNPNNPDTPTDPSQPISFSHSFTAVEVTSGTFGSVPGSFIENYLKPYFTNAQLVTVDNKKYIELTLIGKAYGVVSFEGSELVSSTGEKLDQVRVIRIPAAKESTHRVDAGEYGIYDLTFTFGVTDEQLASGGSVNPEPEQPTNPVDPEPEQPTNPVDSEPEQPTNPVDSEPEQPTNPVDPKPEQPTAPINVTHSFTAVEVTPGTFGSVPGSFIENYLKPYFTNAQLVTVDNKKYIELTLIGKAYGVVSFEGSELVSSTGEKLEQIRIIRIPAAKESTHRVDAGEYGIYDLTLTFGVTDEQLASSDSGNTPAPVNPTNDGTTVAKPTTPSNTNNAIITKPNDLKLTKNAPTPITFNFGSSTQAATQSVLDSLKDMIPAPTIELTDDSKLKVKFTVTPKAGVKQIRILRGTTELGIWTNTSQTAFARIASLVPFFVATSTNDIEFTTDSLEGLTFEVIDSNNEAIKATPAVEVNKSFTNTGSTIVSPSAPSGGGTVTSNTGTVTNRESISYTMVSDPNGPMADFMTNYMTPYFSNAQLVTVSGKNYIELTLTGKAYGFQNLRVTGGYTVISSEGEKMEQVRVIRFPAKKDVTIHVDSGDLGYGAYDLLFTFELSEEQMANAASGGSSTGGTTTGVTITPQIVSEGEITFTIPAESSAIVAYAKKIASKIVNGQYEVAVTLATDTDLETFIVKQGDNEIARWDKKGKTASLAATSNTNVLTFTTSSIDDLTFIATTKYRTIEAKIGATLPTKEVEQVSQNGRQSMTYTMVADPNGPMADFIGNYLAPYFSNAVYVTEKGKEYVELTLTGKAYGFAKLQYIDADGNNVDVDILSSTGEQMDQVRVIRLPLVQDKDGITKIFVDSGDLGYGAYTLFFKFNVPANSRNTVATIPNPFKDIDSVYSKDDILALYAAGITTGTSETSFSPNANMTRAQFAVMVARALGVSSSVETKFKDVQGKWYAKEVQALVELGILTGVSETKFKPADKITRQQAAVIIHRMLKHKGYTNTTTAEALNFKDNVKVADYAKEALAELQAQGIMTGSDGKVNPKANLTRAQMAKILKNAADLVGLLD